MRNATLLRADEMIVGYICLSDLKDNARFRVKKVMRKWNSPNWEVILVDTDDVIHRFLADRQLIILDSRDEPTRKENKKKRAIGRVNMTTKSPHEHFHYIGCPAYGGRHANCICSRLSRE